MQEKDYLAEAKQLVEEYLEKAVPEQTGVSEINKAVRYSLLAGGKRVRPLLLMAAAEASGKQGSAFLPVAAGLEMIHTYSLVHDDLPAMDDDDYRRGRLTNHKVFGEAKAILAGDALLTMAFEIMLSQTQVAAEVLVQTVREIAFYAGDRGMVGGQVIDLDSEGKALTLAELQKMHLAKTGALFKAAILAGGRLAEANEEQLAALENYAENYGLAFQITDDILDVQGDGQQMGKTPGSDERKEKATYVSAYGLEGAKKLASQHIEAAIQALHVFGSQAKYLAYLAEALLERKS